MREGPWGPRVRPSWEERDVCDPRGFRRARTVVGPRCDRVTRDKATQRALMSGVYMRWTELPSLSLPATTTRKPWWPGVKCERYDPPVSLTSSGSLAIGANTPLTTEASTAASWPVMRILTAFSTPGDGSVVKLALCAGANCTSEIPIAVRACTMTPATPLPETETVQTPGSGRVTITIRSARKFEKWVTPSPVAGKPDGRTTSIVCRHCTDAEN